MELEKDVVVGGKQGAKLWDWIQQYPRGAIVPLAGLFLELLPPAVSKEGELPAAQPDSIRIAAFGNPRCCLRPARFSVSFLTFSFTKRAGKQRRSRPLANNKHHLAGLWGSGYLPAALAPPEASHSRE